MKQLKKVVYAITEHGLKLHIGNHEKRGWVVASEVKPHRRGLGVLMKWGSASPIEKQKGRELNASNH
jgi:hypothetical protein